MYSKNESQHTDTLHTMNIWLRRLALSSLAIVLSGAITAYIGGGLVAFALVLTTLATAYVFIPKYRLHLERVDNSVPDE